jgi:hypothetical protein
MNVSSKVATTFLFMSFFSFSYAQKDEHESHVEKKQANASAGLKVEKHVDHDEDHHDKESDHDNDHNDEHKGEHEDDHHEEENNKIGPTKGILKADKELGFILSPEAVKNFGMSTLKLNASSSWTIPLKARVLSKDEVNLFRIRNGHIKRIDFEKLSNDGDNMKVKSSELQSGDEVIVDGVGYVRIAEITAFGGGSEGHSH